MKGAIISIGLMVGLVVFGCKNEHKNNPATLETGDKQIIEQNVGKPLSANQLQTYKHQLHQLFDTGLIKRRFNGAVLIAKDGQILYKAYIGYKDPSQKKDTIDAQTAFHLASTSKPFTGMAILRLVEQGKLHLEDPVTKFFPAFPYPEVTLKQLLSHRSGLPNYLFFMEDHDKWPKNKAVTNQDVLNFLTTYRPPLNYKPGTRFSYCNTNYVLLALIIEKISGKPFPAYMHETIFAPLGMQHTFVYTPADEPRVIKSYKPSGGLWANDMFDDTYGDKNVYSTVRDMVKWDSALYSPQFIRPSLLDSAYQPQSHEKPSIHNYGLGWRLLNYPNGKNVIYHFGKWHGFTPAFARLTDEKAVIIVLGNQYNQSIYESAKTAYSVFGDYQQNKDSSQQEDETSSTDRGTLPLTVTKENTVKKQEPKAKPREPKPHTTNIKFDKKHVNTSLSSKLESKNKKESAEANKVTPNKNGSH